jgi:toxin YoeB
MTKRKAEVVISFTAEGWEDYVYWSEADRAMLRRINRLIRESLREPFAGIGKPEPLKHAMAGSWSRRIDQEHRLVYVYEDGHLIIVQCRYHY